MQKRFFVILGAVAALTACSRGTDPAATALDGEWSTGHTAIGLEFGISLSWTEKHVVGTGSYIAFPPSPPCGPLQVTGQGTVGFTASRMASSEVQGQMTFGSGPPLPYQGTLTNTAQPGFERVEGSLIGQDGTQCTLWLYHALIP